MKKLNICLVSLTLPPDRQGGESYVFKGYYDYLRAQGHNVKVLTGKWNVDISDPNVIQVNFIKKRFFWVPQFNLKAVKWLRSYDFDIFHGNGPKGTYPLILSNKKRFISTIHDLGPFETPFTKIPLEKFLIKYVAKRATYITTVSEFVKKEFNYYMPKIDTSKLKNLYNGIDPKFKPYPKEAQKLKEKLNLKGPIILYIGRIAKYKGLEDVINAYNIAKKSIPELNLIIGGKPDYMMAKSYQQWKRKYKNIVFLGFVPDKKVPLYYSMADVFVTYSYASEGFGLTPIEAIACGTPVVCSSMLAYKEVLQDNALFVPPQKPQILAEELVKFLKNESIRKGMVQKAQEFIKRYSWDVIGKNLEKLYDIFIAL